MATSHDIGMLANNQMASFGNMTNFARSIQPLGAPMPGQQQQQQQGGFGMMAMAGTAFTPMGPAFSPPGSFPGQGVQRAAIGISGAMAQGAGAAVPGRGTLGIAGMLAGGPVGLAAGLAAGTMGDFITSTITQTVQNMSATTNMMQAQRFQFGRGQGMPAQGAFSASQIAQVAGGIQNMGMSDVLTSVSEIREITSQLANMGIFQVARDVPDIMGKLGATMKALRTIAVSAQTTLAEAIPILGQLRQAGITQGPQAAAAVQGMAAGQRAGVSFTQQMQAGLGSAQQAMAAGLPGPQAFQGAVDATVNLAKARQTGSISEEDFQRLTLGTGDPSIAGRIMQGQNMNAVQGAMSIVAGGAMGVAGAQPGMFGAAPFGQFINMAASNLSNPQAMVSLMNRQDQVAGALSADQFSMVRIARSMAESIPGNRDEMTMLVLQRRMGLTPFQARMQMQLFNTRHQQQLAQTIDSQAQAETDRLATFMRENSPAALVNKAGRFAFRQFGGQNIAEGLRIAQSTMAGEVQRFFGRAAGIQAVAISGTAEQTLAGLIAGTEDISMLRDVRRTGALNPAGGFMNALGWNSLGSRRGGILASGSEAVKQTFFGTADVSEVDVETAIDQVREAQTLRKELVGSEEKHKMQAVIDDIRANRDFMFGEMDVTDRFKALSGIQQRHKLSHEQMRTLATLASEDFGKKLTEGVTFGRLNINEIQEAQTRNLQDMASTLHTVPWFGDTTRRTNVSTTEAQALSELALKPEFGSQIAQIAEGFASDVTSERAAAASQADILIGELRDSGDKDKAEVIRETVHMWGNPVFGKEQAKKFSDLQSKGINLRKKFEMTSAAISFGTTMRQGMANLPKELQTGPMAKTIESVAKALQAGNQTAFRRAHERMIVKTITEFEKAEGDVGRLQEMRTVAKAMGVEAILESVSELSPEERGIDMASGVQKAVENSLKKMQSKITGEERAGQKTGVRGGAGGPNEAIHERQIELLGLLARGLEATINDKPELRQKIREAQREVARKGGNN